MAIRTDDGRGADSLPELALHTQTADGICMFIMPAGGIMLPFRFVMIKSEPATTKVTMSKPNASASTLFVLSGPVVMCRKKTR